MCAVSARSEVPSRGYGVLLLRSTYRCDYALCAAGPLSSPPTDPCLIQSRFFCLVTTHRLRILVCDAPLAPRELATSSMSESA